MFVTKKQSGNTKIKNVILKLELENYCFIFTSQTFLLLKSSWYWENFLSINTGKLGFLLKYLTKRNSGSRQSRLELFLLLAFKLTSFVIVVCVMQLDVDLSCFLVSIVFFTRIMAFTVRAENKSVIKNGVKQ